MFGRGRKSEDTNTTVLNCTLSSLYTLTQCGPLYHLIISNHISDFIIKQMSRAVFIYLTQRQMNVSKHRVLQRTECSKNTKEKLLQ